jgi:hypothetical protein
MSGLINLLIRLQMAWRGVALWRPFLQQTRSPAAVQQAVLKSILARNRQSRFGREHGFASITSPQEYAARVPLQSYEDLRPYIEQQQRGEPRQLTVEEPILFAQTSGTTGKAKYIPILPRTVKQAKTNQRLFAHRLYSALPAVFRGKTLAFVSPAIEGVLPSGIPFGSMSGLIYRSMPWLLRRRYVIPSAVFECRDHEIKYTLIAAFAVAEESVTLLAAANPSTFLKLAGVIRSNLPALIASVETGKLPGLERLDSATTRVIAGHFKANSARALALRKIAAGDPAHLFSALWPALKAVSCWREGSCRLLLPALGKLLNPDIPLLELGYLSSEARGSLPVDSAAHREVPSLHENYFEFIERSTWEAGREEIRTLAELEIGRAYYVILTTPAGLYRYFMNDVIRVDGRFEQTPTIKFVEKGAGVTNITGEKLYESQVAEAVEAVLADTDVTTSFFLMVANEEQQRYDFYLEAPDLTTGGFIEKLDTQIAARNLEFQAKRLSGRLHPTRLTLLRTGTSDAFKAHFVREGQREAQFKFVRLHTRAKLTFDLAAHCLNPHP